ncbi:MAG TPA: fumarylacetoacetate hydrolase family protein [Chthonomonadales bacterium]|nr:fumarylacetoacetate hydrolase family protein [Chthonomonadales bacterium]
MRIVRVLTGDGRTVYGSLQDDNSVREIEGDVLGSYRLTDRMVDVKKMLAPIQPPNILCIGGNYRRHIEEGGGKIPEVPPIFMKPTTALNNPGDPIRLPADAPDEVDYEAEIAIVIGKLARNVSVADAPDYILGYCCVNDVSARDCQLRRDIQWTRGKGFDTFCPAGPFIHTTVNPNHLRIRSILNGKVMQDSNTSDMIFSCADLVSYLSHQFTLLPGTLICTGTPEGVGFARKPPVFLRPGDTITVEIEQLGSLTNPVVGPEG